MAIRIEIVRVAHAGSERVVFVPSPMRAPAGQIVFWCNLDPKEAHHINVCPHPVARFRGQPPADCTAAFLVPGPMTYSCLLHPGEHGDIT